MKSDLLKTLALKAKNRMIHKKIMGENSPYRDYSPLCEVKRIDEEEDELFYDRVKRLLSSEEGIKNPIKKLMDEQHLSSLDARAKEKYLLDTIEKYLKCRKMIEVENQSKLVY